MILGQAFHFFVADSGVSSHASELGMEFRKAGGPFEKVYTNTLAQFLSNGRPVYWQRQGLRAPALSATGQVNLVGFNLFLTHHPSVKLAEIYGPNGELQSGFNLIEDGGEYEVITYVMVNRASGRLSMKSTTGTYKHGNR